MKGNDNMKQQYELSFEFIRYRMKALKINLKAECEKHDKKYVTIQTALSKKLDLKASQLIFLAEILDCNIQDLFRKVEK